MTTPSTTIDFGPLLELRAEYDLISEDLCRHIDDDDPTAIGIGQQLLDRELAICETIQAQFSAMRRAGFEQSTDDTANFLFGLGATGELCAHMADVSDRMAVS